MSKVTMHIPNGYNITIEEIEAMLPKGSRVYFQLAALTDKIVALQENNYKLSVALRNLVVDCSTTVSCDDFNHRTQGDLHGAEDDCPPCCRYYKSLYEAQELLK